MSTPSLSSLCLASPSLPSTTGLGIRLSFYLLWFGLIPATLLRTHSPAPYTVLRAAHAILCSAVFIGLALTVVASLGPDSTDNVGFGAVEVYIATLLVSGTAYITLGVVFWTGMRRCLSPTGSKTGHGQEKGRRGRGGKKMKKKESGSRNKGGKEREGCGLMAIMEFILLLTVCGFQLWFWCSGVVGLARRRDEEGCEKAYGFLFAKADLGSVGFRAFNIAVVLVVLVGGMVMGVRSLRGGRGEEKKKRRMKKRKTDGPTSNSNMDQLQLLFNLLIATTVLVAIELAMHWNRVSSEVNKINSASQLIPLVFCLVLIAVCIVDWFSSSPNSGGHRSRSSRSSGRGIHTSGSGSGGSGGSGSGGSRRSRKESRHPSRSSASSSKSSPGPPRPSNIFPAAPPPPAAGPGGFRPPMPPMTGMPPPPFPPFSGSGPPGPFPPPGLMFGGHGTRTASASGSHSGRESDQHSEHEEDQDSEGDYHPDSIDEEERGGSGGSAPPPSAPAPLGAFSFPPQPPPPAQFPGAPPPLPPGFGPPGGGGGGGGGGGVLPPGMVGRGSGGGPPAFFPFAPPGGGSGRGTMIPPPLPPGFGPR